MENCKNFILPTDFSVKSLNLVREALEMFPNTRVNLWLVHGIHLPTSITELLFYSKLRHLARLQNEEFKSACHMIRNKYHDQLYSMNVDLINSINPSYIKAFIEAREITEVLIAKNYKFRSVEVNSFDLSPLLRGMQLNKTELNWRMANVEADPAANPISDLFGTGDISLQVG